MRLAILTLCLALSGCLTVRTVHTTCLPLRNYSQAEQSALAAQLATVPPNSPLAMAVVDLEQMRDMDRACLAAK